MSNSSRRMVLKLLSSLGLSVAAEHSARAEEKTASVRDTACFLTPQSEEGPFYADAKLVRSDIADGKTGVPLIVRLRVIEGGSCQPISGARVDLWHCDAQGVYSAYPGQGDRHDIDTSGSNFLRGIQMADRDGWVAFKTIYPGWYDGRTTHLHFKVFLDHRETLTGQPFLPDALSEFIYRNVPAYGGRPHERDVVNVNDHVVEISDPGRKAFCAIKEDRDNYVAELTLAVDRNTKPAADQDRRPPGPPPLNMPEGGPMVPRPIKDRQGALIPGFRSDP